MLSPEQQKELRECLSHMHIAELKEELISFKLSPKGINKKELIDRLMHYIITGTELASHQFPDASKSKPGVLYPIAPTTLMLYGSYKNDTVTRQFFKQLIGDHFHFTARGIDWLRRRWIAGNPPTYAEFAHRWQAEYEQSKSQKRGPKQEWAYIRFVQKYTQQFPHASQSQATIAWDLERKKQVEKARSILKEFK